MNIRYPIYEGVYRILTNESGGSLPHLRLGNGTGTHRAGGAHAEGVSGRRAGNGK